MAAHTPAPLCVSSWYRLSLHLYLNMGAAGWVAGQPRVAEWTDMGGQRMGDNVLGGLGTCDLGGGAGIQRYQTGAAQHLGRQHLGRAGELP